MKHRLLLSAALLAATMTAAAAPVNFDLFPKNSPLAQSKWVKVFTEETGVYEISYDQLRAMGFSDPQKVCVYGNGGRLLDENFTNISGVATHTGSVTQIPVYYGANAIYFYGQGTGYVGFTSDSKYETKGKFQRMSKNIYSTYGSYLLSDSGTKMTLGDATTSTSGTDVAMMVDFVYHEQDLHYNPALSGQLFWGEVFGYGEPTERTFGVPMDDPAVGTKAFLQTDFYYTDASSSTVSFGFQGEEEVMELTLPSSQTYNYIPVSKAYQELTLPSANPLLDVKFSPTGVVSQGMLDFWILTYQKNTPTLSQVPQSRVTLPSIKNGNYYRIALSSQLPSGTKIWDISNPMKPTNVAYTGTTLCAKATASNPSLVFFDPLQKQKQIKSCVPLPNSNLHAEATRGIDLLIITTRSFRARAQQLADLHEQDGLNVLVALDTDIYNEFQGGTADPMAYKWLIKMLRENKARPLRNVLFFGPMGNDLRGILTGGTTQEHLIAYQSTNVSRTTGAANINDFYGILSNYSSLNTWEREMEVGVGVLPVLNDREAAVAVEKVRRWLNDDSFAYRVNSIMHYSSSGDAHLSDISAVESTARFDDALGNPFIITPLVVDDFGGAEARRRFTQILSNGNLFSIYYGHGDPTFVAPVDKFFGPMHLNLMKNEPLSFTIFAGCSLSNFDRGNGGIGKMMTLDTNNGLVGTILATRETYANENVQITNAMVDAMTSSTAGTTIGQMFAKSKSTLNLAHEHQYQLVCDPALVIPFPFLTMQVDNMSDPDAENFVTVEGRVMDRDGQFISNFNGDAVIRVVAPGKVSECRNVISGNSGTMEIEYADEILSVASGKVENGCFAMRVFIPAHSETEETTFNGSIALAAYDNEQHFGAASRTYVDLTIAPLEPASKIDNTAPFVNMEYDDVDVKISLRVKDNLRLNLATTPLKECLHMRLDGTLLPFSYAGLVYVDSESKEAHYIVRLPNLPYGTHTFQVEATDFAGNATTSELVFSVGISDATLGLSMVQAAMRDSADFVVDGEIPAEGLMFVILSSDGEEIAHKVVTSNEFSWSISELPEDTSLEAGVYTAHVTSLNPSYKAWSKRISLPVLDAE